MSSKQYRLHFKLTKHKDAHSFNSVVVAKDGDDIQGIKEERAMYFEKLYGTPVKCTKIEEIKEKQK
jgi:hypothetical protein